MHGETFAECAPELAILRMLALQFALKSPLHLLLFFLHFLFKRFYHFLHPVVVIPLLTAVIDFLHGRGAGTWWAWGASLLLLAFIFVHVVPRVVVFGVSGLTSGIAKCILRPCFTLNCRRSRFFHFLLVAGSPGNWFWFTIWAAARAGAWRARWRCFVLFLAGGLLSAFLWLWNFRRTLLFLQQCRLASSFDVFHMVYTHLNHFPVDASVIIFIFAFLRRHFVFLRVEFALICGA